MRKKDFQDRAKRIRSLIKKDDGEIPDKLDELFQNINPAELHIAEKEYLLAQGMSIDEINDEDSLADDMLILDIDEWAPALFRLLGSRKKRAKWEKERIIALDDNQLIDDKTALRIENRALISQKIKHLVLNPPNSNTVSVLKIILEDSDTTQPQIAKKLKISQRTVSRTFQLIRKRLTS